MGVIASDALFDADAFREAVPRTLRERFVVPPFSVLDAAQGYWQDRKRAWLSLGIESEVGREQSLAFKTLSALVPNYYALKTAAEARVGRSLTNDEFEQDHLDTSGLRGIAASGTSIFDPVVAELAYRWWSPSDGVVLDPFAGGSVRGVVAGALGRAYHGVDLRPEQVEANRDQAAAMAHAITVPPTWYVGDAATDLPDIAADLIFSCPPYGDLEVYSDDPRDLSVMSWPGFVASYRRIIGAAVDRLREDRFAVFVVGNFRDPRTTALRDLVGLTIAAFGEAGADYYGDLALVVPVGTAAMRSHTFHAGRKPIRRHQYVLVFVKGDWHAAAAAAESFREPEGD